MLTETSAGAGTQLLANELRANGYSITYTAVDQDRGVLIASRRPIGERLRIELNVTLPWRMAAIEVLDSQLVVVGVYVPSRDRSPAKIARKQRFIESLLNGLVALPDHVRQTMVLVGDYNVVSRDHVPRLRGYFDYEYQMLESLEELGFTAGHRLDANGPHPHSWIGRNGRGYLYDYFHFGQQIARRVVSCDYHHITRELQLSDHAAVTTKLRFAAQA